MNWYSNLKVKAKLMTAFVVVVLFSLLLSIVASYSFHRIGAADKILYEVGFVNQVGASSMLEHFSACPMHVRDLIIETDTAKLQTFKANLDNSRKAARDILNVIWGAAKGIPEREAVAQPIEDAFNEYEIELAACVELAMANRNAESLDYMRRVTFPKFLKTKKSMDDLILFMRAEGEAQLESNNATIASSNLVMFTFTGVAIIFSLLFGNYIAKLITSTIGQVTSNLAKVADGDLTVVSKAEHRDELGTMAESLNHTVVGLRQLISSLKKRH